MRKNKPDSKRPKNFCLKTSWRPQAETSRYKNVFEPKRNGLYTAKRRLDTKIKSHDLVSHWRHNPLFYGFGTFLEGKHMGAYKIKIFRNISKV